MTAVEDYMTAVDESPYRQAENATEEAMFRWPTLTITCSDLHEYHMSREEFSPSLAWVECAYHEMCRTALSFSDVSSNAWIEALYCLQNEAWAAGGSGILLKTTDGGKNWARDKLADNIAANLYAVR